METKEIRLPEIGEGVTEGEIVKYLVKPGDTVAPDQPIVEIMTDKASVEVPSPTAGVVKSLMAKEGDTVAVEGVLLTLDVSAGRAQEAAKPNSGSGSKAQSDSVTKVSSNPPNLTQVGKPTSVELPELGEGVTEGELVRWLVNVGDEVKADQPIVEIMTDKASVEVPSPVSGRISRRVPSEGDTVKVGSVLVEMDAHTGGVPTSTSEKVQSAIQVNTPATKIAESPISQVAQVTAPDFSNVLASPATRRLAREMDVDLNQIKGSGPAGRITREDVLAAGTKAKTQEAPRPAAQIPVPSDLVDKRVPIKGIRKKISENMQNSKRTVPHFTIADRAVLESLVQARENLKPAAEKKGVKVTYMPFVMKALAATVREFPEFNASIDDEAQEIVYHGRLNVGFAADTPQGLLVPVIHDLDQKNLWQISSEVYGLGTRARDGKLKLEEMKGATITVTNIGAIGGTFATPIINHPEVAILGMYKLEDTPFKVMGPSGEVGFEFKPTMNFTLTCDHRLIDGAVAARFLKALIARLENPTLLLMDMR